VVLENDLTDYRSKGIISLLKNRLLPGSVLAEPPLELHPRQLNKTLEVFVETYLYIALIITSIALVASVILQSKGAGLGGLTGGDTGGIFTARRGIEKILFWVTIGLSVLFFTLAILTTLVAG
jgi:preprotein translocase subunit SecG